MLRRGHNDRVVDLDRLAQAARHGDDVAVGELVRATQPVVWRTCRAMGSGFDPDDLVQEVYLRALRNLASFTGDGGFVAWILTIARRVCADEVRRVQRQRRLVERIGVWGAASTDAPAAAHGTDHLDALLDAIDPARREAFVLTQMVGLSYDEAAEVCQCPIGTIRSRVARARADLVGLVERSQAR